MPGANSAPDTPPSVTCRRSGRSACRAPRQPADQVGARGRRDLGDQLGGFRVAGIDMDDADRRPAVTVELSVSEATQSNSWKLSGGSAAVIPQRRLVECAVRPASTPIPTVPIQLVMPVASVRRSTMSADARHTGRWHR